MTSPGLAVRVRPRMGTFLGLTLAGSDEVVIEEAARRGFALAAGLERLMSSFDPESWLSEINRRAGLPVTVPAELARVLCLARRLARLTDGAFDPTVAPLLALWREAARRGRRPSAEAIRRARRRVGWRGLRIVGRRVRLARPGMALDLGAFGKGWAADRIAMTLGQFPGLTALINFGESSLVALGTRASGPSIILRHPLGGVAGAFELRNRACSTSAVFGRRWGVRGRRRSHVLDTRSCQPLATAAQVTVIARRAAVAEAVSTALLVLGRPAVARTARRLRCEVCWVDAHGVVTTPGFRLHGFRG